MKYEGVKLLRLGLIFVVLVNYPLLSMVGKIQNGRYVFFYLFIVWILCIITALIYVNNLPRQKGE